VISLDSLQRLGERERRIVIIGGAVAIVLLILALLMPLQQSVNAGAQRLEHKRDDLTWLQSVAPQLGGLAVTAPAPLHESLVALVDRTARAGGIGKSLVGSQPSGNGGLNVHFEQVPFDALVSWLSQLGDRYGVHADQATIEAVATPGVVDATLVLRAH
jgi:general secretion pathway protein M